MSTCTALVEKNQPVDRYKEANGQLVWSVPCPVARVYLPTNRPHCTLQKTARLRRYFPSPVWSTFSDSWTFKKLTKMHWQ